MLPLGKHVQDLCGPCLQGALANMPSTKPIKESQQTPAISPVLLAPLVGLRFFLAMHVFLFHFIEHEPLGQGAATGRVVDAWPEWLGNLAKRGYCSTSFFFIISGFIMTYFYADGAGRLVGGRRSFFVNRLARLYPLHILVCLLLAPHAVMIALGQPNHAFLHVPISPDAFVALSALSTITMTQAWVPEFALTWNPPTWALSAVVFFSLIFPGILWLLRAIPTRVQKVLLVSLPLVSLVPSMLYFLVFHREVQFSFWHEIVMRSPLLWLPHLVMGIFLARCLGQNRYVLPSPQRPNRGVPSWGDAAAVLMAVILCLSDAVLSRWLWLGGCSPHLFLRHGLLAPLFLVIMHDLATNRGLLAKFLALPAFVKLADMSFSIFILQSPVMVLVDHLFKHTNLNPQMLLLITTSVLFVASWLSVHYFEKPVSKLLRTFLSPKKKILHSYDLISDDKVVRELRGAGLDQKVAP
jgi:peptidoglycan/LPS O-acetylase OafA/YrhL